MKTIMHYSLVLFAGLSIALSCSKIGAVDTDNAEAAASSGKQVTIHATLSDATTRVEYALDENGDKPKLTLKWESTDVLVVSNASGFVEIDNPTIDETGKTASFSGTLPEGGEPYKVHVKHVETNLGATQTQAADGDLTHLEYAAMAEDVTEADFDNLTLTQTTGVLGLIAKLPTDVSASVKAVIFQTESNLFNGSNTLTVNLGTPGAGTDNILYVYANVAAASIPKDTKMFIRFKVGDGENDYYTRYQVFASDVTLNTGALNGLKLNCSHIDKYAGKDDKGTEAAPYLIADKYQMKAVGSLMVDNAKTYFKMLDDVDMDGINWDPLNTGEGYPQLVDFNGNEKRISNLGKHMFYVLKGSVYDLTLDHSTITTRGILAEYIQGSGNVVTDVTVLGGTVNAANSDNVGGLVGTINGSGSDATIQDCTVTGTDVKGKGVVGGVIGFADAKVTVSGCKYQSGNVTGSARYIGGFVGSTGNYESTFTNCQVEATTINANHTADVRGGGFVGQLQNNVKIFGCTVGEADAKVTINTKEPTDNNVINIGGFVGVCYGKITKNGDVRSKAYVKMTSTNTLGTPLKLGGFVGFHAGNIEYCDAVVDMTGLKGQHIGGFAGYVIKNNATRLGRLDNCSMEGQVTGNNYTGGFAGYVDTGSPEISNSSASGSVTAQSGCGGFVGQSMTGVFTNDSAAMDCSFSGSNNGGFVGQIHGGTMTGCSASGSLTRTGGSTYGGFAGLLTNNGTTLEKCSAEVDVTNNGSSYSGAFIGLMDSGTILVKRCYATGNVTSNQSQVSTFIARIVQASGKTLNVTIENCFAAGSIIGSNQVRGGLVGSAEAATSLTFSKCYASGSIVGSFRLGGLIGNLNNAAAVVENCAAWNSEVTASTYGNANWSSGAVIGTAHPNSHLTNNYRKHEMSLTAFWVPASDYSQPDVDGTTHPLTDSTGAEMTDTAMASGQSHYPLYPYHGKVEAGKTLSQLASTTLGWSSEVWDFSGDEPTLK